MLVMQARARLGFGVIFIGIAILSSRQWADGVLLRLGKRFLIVGMLDIVSMGFLFLAKILRMYIIP